MPCDTPVHLHLACVVSDGGLILFAAGAADTAGARAPRLAHVLITLVSNTLQTSKLLV